MNYTYLGTRSLTWSRNSYLIMRSFAWFRMVVSVNFITCLFSFGRILLGWLVFVFRICLLVLQNDNYTLIYEFNLKKIWILKITFWDLVLFGGGNLLQFFWVRFGLSIVLPFSWGFADCCISAWLFFLGNSLSYVLLSIASTFPWHFVGWLEIAWLLLCC